MLLIFKICKVERQVDIQKSDIASDSSIAFVE